MACFKKLDADQSGVLNGEDLKFFKSTFEAFGGLINLDYD